MSSGIVSKIGRRRSFSGKSLSVMSDDSLSRQVIPHLLSLARGITVTHEARGEGAWIRIAAQQGKWLPLFSPWFLLFSEIRWNSDSQGETVFWSMEEVLGSMSQHLRWMLTPSDRVRTLDVRSQEGAVAFLNILRYDQSIPFDTRTVLDPLTSVWNLYATQGSYEFDELLERVRHRSGR